MREGPIEVTLIKVKPESLIKIEKEGLLCENLSNNIETVRGNVKVTSGKWFYEVKILSSGSIKIGWCTDKYIDNIVNIINIIKNNKNFKN
jgi:hypothetical protein